MSQIKRTRTLTTPSCLSLASHIYERVSLIWTQRSAPTYQRLSRNVAREVSSYLGLPTMLTKLTPTKLLLFDVGKGLGMKTTLPVDKDYRTPTYPGESVCIGDMQVFICGGCCNYGSLYTGLKATRVWDHGTTEKLPDMLYGRRSHALFFDMPSLSLFVFGGVVRGAVALDTCERFQLRQLKWTLLPSMNSKRTRGSVCQHRRKAYFCRTQKRPFEVFAFESERFRELSLLEYPAGIALYVESCMAFVGLDEGQRNLPQKVSVARLFGRRIVVGRFAYDFTHGDSRCSCLDLGKLEVVGSYAISLKLESERSQSNQVASDN